MQRLVGALSFLAASLVHAPALPAPVVAGPHDVTAAIASYTFRESGVHAARFICALDSTRLRPCRARVRLALGPGGHVLRVQARVGRRRSPLTSVSLLRLSASSTSRFSVGQAPVDVAAGAGSLWVSDASSGNVYRVDGSGRVVATINVGGAPRAITFAADSVWVASEQTATLSRIDPASNRIVAAIPIRDQCFGLTYDGSSLWATTLTGALQRIDVGNNRVVDTIAVRGQPEFALVAAGRLWVTNEDGTIAAFDLGNGKALGPPIAIDRDVDGIASDGKAIWVVTYYSGTVAEIDSATGKVVWRRRLPSRLFGITFVNGDLWVTLQDRGLLERLDPANGKVIEAVRVAGSPGRLVDDGSGQLWVVDQTGGLVKVDEAREK